MSDYYQIHFQEYFNQTISLDPTGFLNPLVERLNSGASILDVGCGSGRDLVWLNNRGYKAIGFERSPDLAKLARNISGCDVFEGDFETYEFSGFAVDALLLVTALVHIPHERLVSSVNNILKALKPNGRAFISLKEGTGIRTDSKGRIFYLWQKQDLEVILTGLNFEIVDFARSKTALNTGEVIISFLLRRSRA